LNLHDLPALNAVLNGTAAVLLVIAFVLIRKGRRDAHKKVMIGAFCVSVAFLISYLTYHFQVGTTRYPHTGTVRTLYFAILGTHTVLAAAVPFLAVISLRRGLRGSFLAHRKIAKWTLPIWLYVSVTGVVVYLMLYQF
jgi:uncharacterized membrane protein YozB (DUF420 family)